MNLGSGMRKDHAYDVIGRYTLSVPIGLVATQAANGYLMSLRWTDAKAVMGIERIKLIHMQAGAHTAALADIRYSVKVLRGYTAVDSAGVALTPFGNIQKHRTSMPASLMSDFRISVAAAGITAGTRTVDTNALMQIQTSYAAANPSPAPVQDEEVSFLSVMGEPLLLFQNEGLTLQGPSTIFGAAGAANIIFEMTWAEFGGR